MKGLVSIEGYHENPEPFGATTTHHRMPPNTPSAKWLIFRGHLSARIGIVQPFTLLEFTVHLGVYGKGCLGARVVVAYTNDGYLRDA
jgi:hypothetical protein